MALGERSVSSCLDIAKTWVKNDPNKKTSSYIEDLAMIVESSPDEDSNATKVLSSLFPVDGSRIDFGTAGLRSAMKPGPLGMNDLVIIQTTQGLARFCQIEHNNHNPDGNNQKLLAVVGYDHRSNAEFDLSSRSFALLTKLVFLEAGMDCVLLDGYVPTPLVAYATTKLNAVVGIMITASHNPKADAGYKVYWSDGCQIRPPLDAGIKKCIQREDNLCPWVNYASLLLQKKTELITKQGGAFVDECLGLSDLEVTKEMANFYYTAIASSGLVTGQSKLLDQYQENNAKKWKPPKISYTAMHGVGYPWAVRSFETFGLPPFLSVPEQEEPDADFPTVPFPNPEEKGALSLAMRFAENNNCDIVLANDPDADRLAVAERCRQSGRWTTFTGDQIGTLLGHWIWEEIGKKSSKPIAMCASTVSSSMLRTIAQKEGFYFEDTLTGFKWIGSRLVSLREKEGYRSLFAYEEAIGFCCGDVVSDKDGLSALSVITELALKVYHSGGNLAQHMQSLYNKYGEFCSSNGYFYCYDPSVISNIIEEMRNNGNYFDNIGPYCIESIRDLGYPGYDSTTEDKKPTLPVSKSSPMMTFRFTNGCVAQFRASGTEPKFKYYLEMRGNPGVSRTVVMEDLKKMKNFLLEELIKPNINGLVQP